LSHCPLKDGFFYKFWPVLITVTILFSYSMLGKEFPGSREEIIEYMASVGYKHIPGGHKVGRSLSTWPMLDIRAFLAVIR
jgi:hypothetical protein